MSNKTKSISITIDGATYTGKVERVEPDRRLIFMLNRYFKDGKENDALDELHMERVRTFQRLFAKKFPDAPKFGQTSTLCGAFSEWKYYFTGARQAHVAWALNARECGLIDNYIVDYDPASRGAEHVYHGGVVPPSHMAIVGEAGNDEVVYGGTES